MFVQNVLLFCSLCWVAEAANTINGGVESQHRRVQADPAICEISQGTIDEAGKCIICVNDNCGCELDTSNFHSYCPNFCFENAIYQNLQQSPCGTLNCTSQGVTSVCIASVPFTADANLELEATCDVLGCDCIQATWDGQPCSDCHGLGDAFDCVNAGGPVKVADVEDGGPASPTANLNRWYVNDTEFLVQVAKMTLPEASNAAGIPIGAAVANGLPGMEDFIPSEYNMAVMENGMKWNKLLKNESVLGIYDFTKADEFVDYCVANDVLVRGHVLIWGRNVGATYPQAVMDQVESASDPNVTLIEIMTEHINAVTSHYAGKVAAWDVVNEHFDGLDPDQNIFYRLMGDDYVKKTFELTKAALPEGVSLVWNEAISSYSMDDVKISAWLELLQRYKDEGVPIDGIGVQGHSISRRHNLTEARSFFQKVVDMGYTVELTEMDSPITVFLSEDDGTDPFQAQADYFGEYAKVCFELPNNACKGITFWGLSDAYTWYDVFFAGTAPNLPLLIDENGAKKPAWLSLRNELGALDLIDAETEEEATEDTEAEAGSEEEGTIENENAGDDEEGASNNGDAEEDNGESASTSAVAGPPVMTWFALAYATVLLIS